MKVCNYFTFDIYIKKIESTTDLISRKINFPGKKY